MNYNSKGYLCDIDIIIILLFLSILTIGFWGFSKQHDATILSHTKSTVQEEIEKIPYDSLNSNKLSNDVSIDVVVNDDTHKQIFIYIKNLQYEYQVIVSKNSDGTSSVRPFIN